MVRNRLGDCSGWIVGHSETKRGSSIGEISPLHSLTPAKANIRRKLVQSPGFNNYAFRMYSSPS
jgi:hypothetical protein